jgi:HlyD family secretion protein
MKPALQSNMVSVPSPEETHPWNMKRGLWILGALTLAALAFAVYRHRAVNSTPTTKFETVKADRGRIVAKVTATGTLSALVTVQVGSQVSGRIQQILVDFNSTVTKGQVIVKLDPQLFDAALEQAQANYLVAQSNVKKANVQAVEADLQYKRMKNLWQQKLVPQADLDTMKATAGVAQAEVEASEAGLAQAQAALHQAEVNLAYTTIASPIDGTVVSRNVDVGQTVAASLQAPILFVIAEDLRKMQVDTSVSEADVGKLKDGMAAFFTVDAYPGERFQGTIRQIRNAAQTVQNVVTYDAVIDLGNPELKLKPGMTANVTFVYAEREDVVRIANAALRFQPPSDLAAHATPVAKPNGVSTTSGHRTVWVLRDAKPIPVALQTGITDGSFTELVEGDVHVDDALIVDLGASSTTRRIFP